MGKGYFWSTLRHHGLKAALWSLLPDNCAMQYPNEHWKCPRTGVLGNENIIEWPNGEEHVMCDDCTVAFHRRFNGM